MLKFLQKKATENLQGNNLYVNNQVCKTRAKKGLFSRNSHEVVMFASIIYLFKPAKKANNLTNDYNLME